MNIKVVRTISNQIIIGDVTDTGNRYIVNIPYYIMPTQQGLQFLPMDAEILGTELPFAELSKDTTIYCTKPGVEISQAYENAISGKGTPAIEQEDKQLILE